MVRQRQIFWMTSLFLCFFSNISADIWINDPEDITEEYLTRTSASSHYTEHVAHLKKVFDHLHVRTFLEFGLGFATKYFIDNSEHVVSVEFIRSEERRVGKEC